MKDKRNRKIREASEQSYIFNQQLRQAHKGLAASI
jgi:hypothetical protein